MTIEGFFGAVLPVAAMLGMTAQLALLGVRRGWEAMAGLDQARRALTPLHERWTLENEALQEVRRKVEDAEKRLSIAEQTLRQTQREIARTEGAPPSFLHRLGQPGPGVRPFRAEVSFDSASARAVGRAVNPVWFQANRLIIHATDLDAARREADRAFPDKGGFMKSFNASAGAMARVSSGR
ncbi:hypothetical protein [Azospirillum agricola]|uniref:hypothetical protein n=1 Tax=Azospirillum agricola TaxID=1720247 RepID=UPI000A0F0C11|nr:hypothetical protein [Azospirillum agricola]SMH55640.1 hypothetical protein SAMN02982994_3868 [Azospirillum lipoferum]